MSMMRPIGGFENLRSGVGDAISGTTAANYRSQMNMASAANRARTRIKAANHGAEAARYAGEQAGRSAMFGGIMSGIGGLASGVVGGLSKLPSGGGQSSAGDTAWGMPDPVAGYTSGVDGSGLNIGGGWSFDSSQYSGSWAPPKAGWSLTGW